MTGTERHYRGDASKAYHEQKRAIPEPAVAWVARLRAEKLQPFVRPTDTVFEFGAGYGWNLIALSCTRKVAYDIADLTRSKSAIEWVGDLHTLPAGFADVVICHHALEHVIAPAATLQLLFRLLKTQGTLLMFVPFEKERRYRFFDATEPNHHLYSWNAQTLGNLTAECGFKVDTVQVAQFGYDRFAAKATLRCGLGERGFRAIRSLAHLVRPASEVRLIGTKPPPE